MWSRLVWIATWLALPACGDEGCGATRATGESRGKPAASVGESARPPGDEPERASAAAPRAEPGLELPAGLRVAAGAAHTCRVTERGEVGCEGSNRFGQLGRADRPRGPEARQDDPVRVKGLEDVASLTAGAFHTCALRRDGSVVCWGHGGYGLLGEGGAGGDDVPSPKPVKGPKDAVALTAGEGFTCARTTRGTARCWGRNDHAQLGRGHRGAPEGPGDVAGLQNVAQLAAGRDHACALLDDGAVRCWGLAIDGQVGARAGGDVAARPVRVPLPEPAVEVAAGGYHTCARVETGEVRCFGSNDSGQLGTGGGGDPSDRRPEPASMAGVDDARALAAGARFTCVLRRTGHVLCAGYNGDGQLGDGTTTLRKRPVPVDGVSDATSLTAGATRVCAVPTTGTPQCWGR
ncbi:MAG: RCC1 domain-containing protein [Myxococcota bacterium]